MSDEQLTLAARQWLRLPGTEYEVMLHGKFRDWADKVTISRDGTGPGGWNLRPVYGACFIRKAPS